MISLFAAALLAGVLLLEPLLSGWVLTILWGWFITPTFNMPPLNVYYAIGVVLTMDLLTGHINSTKTEYREGVGHIILFTFLRPLLVLVLGWAVTQFV